MTQTGLTGWLRLGLPVSGSLRRVGRIEMKDKLKLSKLLHLLEGEALELAKNLFKEQGDVAVKRARMSAEPELEPGERAVKMYVSTRDMDRDNEIILPKGMDLKQYLKSPVVLESHDYSQLPIGKAEWIKADDYGVKAKISFAPTPEGDKAWALAQFLPLTASVGFIPTEAIDNSHPDWSKRF